MQIFVIVVDFTYTKVWEEFCGNTRESLQQKHFNRSENPLNQLVGLTVGRSYTGTQFLLDLELPTATQTLAILFTFYFKNSLLLPRI